MNRLEPLSKSLKTIGGRMKLYRESVAQIKGKEMAALLGISAGAYSDLESNKKKPSANVFVSYCTQPRMDMHWLLTGEVKTETAKKIYRRLTGNYDDEEEIEDVGILLLMQEHMVGNKEIDNGRKYLISLMNTIEAAVNSEFNADVGLNHVAEMHVYAKEHFKIEEEIQRNIKFKTRTAHKKMHKRLIDDLDSTYRYIESAEEGDHKELVLESTAKSLE
jgi:hemerythrin-like metal-binding protein